MIEFHFNEETTPSGSDQAYGSDILVTDYEGGGWEGSGESLYLKDGKVYCEDLGHCSCYGPFENGGDAFTIERFKELNESVTTEWSTKVGSKFLELLIEFERKNAC